MTIYDCDDYTQAYYQKDCNVNVERNLLHEKTKPGNLLVKPPPHTITSVGKEEDSIQNCLPISITFKKFKSSTRGNFKKFSREKYEQQRNEKSQFQNSQSF